MLQQFDTHDQQSQSAIMDQRELSTRLQALQKAINDKEPAANVIAIMETLKKEVVPTEELLRASPPSISLSAHSTRTHVAIHLTKCSLCYQEQ